MLVKDTYIYISLKKKEEKNKSGYFYANLKEPTTATKEPAPIPRPFLAQRFKIRRTQRLGERDAAVARILVVEEGGRLDGIDSRWGGGGCMMRVCGLGDGECVSDGFSVSMVVLVVLVLVS